VYCKWRDFSIDSIACPNYTSFLREAEFVLLCYNLVSLDNNFVFIVMHEYCPIYPQKIKPYIVIPIKFTAYKLQVVRVQLI